MDILLSISSEMIPIELTPRFQTLEWTIGYVLFFAFIALAIARFARGGIYQTLLVANGKFLGVVAFVRDAMPLSKPSSLLLVINYALSGGAVCYLYAQNSNVIDLNNNLVVFFIPLIVLVWNIACLAFTRFLTGVDGPFAAPITLKIIGAQLLGLIYFLCAILWLFIPGQENFFGELTLILFISESALRIVKSTNLVLRRGVSWYYIILYFCTLEILPLVMVYYAVQEGFN